MGALFSRDVVLLLGVLSVGMFIGSLIAIPIILVRLPHDYFDEAQPQTWFANRHPAIRMAAKILKNAVGAIFLLAGIAMIVLPGQGVLSILIGVSLMDLPGKRKFERKLIGQPSVLQTINKLRAKFNRPELVIRN